MAQKLIIDGIEIGYKDKKIKLSSNILYGLAIGGMLTVGAISPLALGAFAAAFLADRKYRARELSNTFYYLRKAGYIKIIRKKSKTHISITQKGEKCIRKDSVKSLQIHKPKRWDGYWRIIFFDIPSEQSSKRNAIRNHLKRLGFYQLQKSVWVHPFDCSKEIHFIKNYLDINDKNLVLALTNTITEQATLKKAFDI